MTSASATALTPSVKPSAPLAASRPISVSSLPAQALGRRGVGVDLGEPDLARAAGEELDDRDIVDRRLGIGQRDHRRDAAGRGGLAAALDRFHVLGAGLAQLHAHVDQPGRQAQPAAASTISASASAVGAASAPTAAIRPSIDEQIAGCVEPARGIEQPRAADQQAARSPLQSAPSFTAAAGPLPRSRARISRQAMRTATPISTCWRIRLRSISSATSLPISTPRFIGPGCMISASGLARAQLVVVEPEEMEVFAGRRHEGAVHALALQPQHHHDVDIGEARGHVVKHLDAQPLDRGRQQGARRHHPHPGAHGVEQRDVRARDPAVQDVAADRHGEPAEPALAAADRQRVEQRLGRVLVAAVAGIDHGAIDLFRQQLHRARFGMAHDQHVGMHGVQGHRRVDQGLALDASS